MVGGVVVGAAAFGGGVYAQNAATAALVTVYNAEPAGSAYAVPMRATAGLPAMNAAAASAAAYNALGVGGAAPATQAMIDDLAELIDDMNV